jgi:hypothetical protein
MNHPKKKRHFDFLRLNYGVLFNRALESPSAGLIANVS